MRILHVISRLDPSDGGPPMALSRLAAAQAAAGAAVTIAALEPHTDRSAMQQAYASIPHFDHVSLTFLPTGGFRERVFAPGAGALLGSLVPAHDIVHVHGLWRPHLLQATRVAQTHRRPWVISPHGMLSLWSMQQKSLKKRLALRLGWNTALERAAFLHVLNRDEGEAVQQVCHPSQIVTLPNGVNLTEVTPSPSWDGVWDRYPALRDTPYIAFVGRLHYSKGLDILAEAFALVARQMPEMRLVVMGPEFGAGPMFREQIRRLGVEERVSILGGVYGVDKPALLRQAQCFCLPSRQEGFSMAIVEALALGLPAVITDACHFPEVAEAGAGSVVPVDGTAVGEALLRLLQDKRRRMHCGQAARTLSHTRYQWSQIAQGFLTAYERALSRQARTVAAA
ncbi:MAG: glycosyltransferase [Nitrospiraceae bacterium]